MTGRAILVAGAGGAVGFEIVRALRARGREVIATYRSPREGLIERLTALGARTEQWDIADTERERTLLDNVEGAIFTPILTVSEIAAAAAPGKRLLFFSSNNVAIDPDAPVYAALGDAETRIFHAAPGAVIIRPTMIYGYPGDGNLSVLMRAMRRYPVTPMIGAGRALQQPVFYRDLAEIAADIAADNERAGAVAVAGPEPLTQAALYCAVRAAAGARSIIAPVPAALAGAGARMAAALGLQPPLSLAQIDRAGRDKTPVGDDVVLGKTALTEGLRALAAALDGASRGA